MILVLVIDGRLLLILELGAVCSSTLPRCMAQLHTVTSEELSMDKEVLAVATVQCCRDRQTFDRHCQDPYSYEHALLLANGLYVFCEDLGGSMESGIQQHRTGQFFS